MENMDILKGKQILIVDDEKDILETLCEILADRTLDTAIAFEDAKELLSGKHYDALILDIMGVSGYRLLRIAHNLKIPVIMLTAHALSAEHFKRSITNGAFAYIPKERMSDIDVYLCDLIRTYKESGRKSGNWFSVLKTYFKNKFGSDWIDKDEEFRRKFSSEFLVNKEHLGNLYS